MAVKGQKITFVLEVNPLTIFIEVFGMPKSFEASSSNSTFALPSTGGDFNLACKASPTTSKPDFDEFGFTLTSTRHPFGCGFTAIFPMGQDPQASLPLSGL